MGVDRPDSPGLTTLEVTTLEGISGAVTRESDGVRDRVRRSHRADLATSFRLTGQKSMTKKPNTTTKKPNTTTKKPNTTVKKWRANA